MGDCDRCIFVLTQDDTILIFLGTFLPTKLSKFVTSQRHVLPTTDLMRRPGGTAKPALPLFHKP